MYIATKAINTISNILKVFLVFLLGSYSFNFYAFLSALISELKSLKIQGTNRHPVLKNIESSLILYNSSREAALSLMFQNISFVIQYFHEPPTLNQVHLFILSE